VKGCESSRTRVVFGLGAVERLGELARGLGARRVLVVTDPGIVAAGHVARAERALAAARVEVRRFAAVREDPTTADVERCLDEARAAPIDLFVGLGGGSSIDTAKGANFLLTNGGRMEDYQGVGRAAKELLPLIAVPTTAGTGSEVQSFALIAREEDRRKMACGDPRAAPRVALLDPALTVTLPRFVSACTGLDALAHAVETAVTRKRTVESMACSREAFALAARALPRVLATPADLAARSDMLRAAALAGHAIELSMLGAAHSLANPLTARFGLHHGLAVGVVLPHVVRYNASLPAARAEYAGLARAAELCTTDATEERALDALIEGIERLLRAAEAPAALAQCGARESDVATLAEEAAGQWTAAFNPREVGREGFEALYRAALGA